MNTKALLELARQEALATDGDWYRAVIGAEAKDKDEDEAAAAVAAGPVSTAAAAPSSTATAAREEEELEEEEGEEVGGRGPLGQRLLTLGYSQEEARGLPQDVASVIVESGIRRPAGPLPAEWLAEDMDVDGDEDGGEAAGAVEEYEAPPPRQRAAAGGRGRGVPPVPVASSRRRRGLGEERRRRARRAAAYDTEGFDDDDDEEEDEEDEASLDEEERAYRQGLQAPIYKPRPGLEDEDDDFGPTFTEQEPGLLPLLLDQVTAKMRASPVLRPLLREDRFKYLLSQEADLRCVLSCRFACLLAGWSIDG